MQFAGQFDCVAKYVLQPPAGWRRMNMFLSFSGTTIMRNWLCWGCRYTFSGSSRTYILLALVSIIKQLFYPTSGSISKVSILQENRYLNTHATTPVMFCLNFVVLHDSSSLGLEVSNLLHPFQIVQYFIRILYLHYAICFNVTSTFSFGAFVQKRCATMAPSFGQ